MTAMIQLNVSDGIARLTLNRPPLNVLNIAMMRQLTEQLAQLRDASIKGIVLDAAGKAFCAGVDVAEHTDDKVAEMIHAFHDLFRALWALPQPLLAVVGGTALGGGMELALACDFIVAAEGAKFGQPEVKVGVFPPIAALLLPLLTSRQAALECVLLGEIWSAKRAYELGLVNAVVPAEQLGQTASEWTGKLASLSAPILRLAKKATLIGWDQQELDSRLARIEKLYLDDLMKLDDTREGLDAFIEKRAPQWQDS